METLQSQSDRERYRVFVIRRQRTELLLVQHEAGFQLPSVEIPRWQRVAENLTSAVKSKWNCDGVCLFDVRAHEGDGCQVIECWPDAEASNGNVSWAPICSLSAQSFQDATDYEAFQQFLAKCIFYDQDRFSPFAKSGWFQQLQSWMAEVIWPYGLRLTGSFRQFNASPSFSLIRFETSGPAVWFKAVGGPNRHEYTITLKLAQLFPEFLPKIIGTRPDWNGWASVEHRGSELGECGGITVWKKAAVTLAELQLESLGNTRQVIASGAYDLSTSALSSLVRPFFAHVTQLMIQQKKVPPPILTEAELCALKEMIELCINQSKDLEIPDALGHLDPNPGNIVVSSDSCAFLDWSEAYVGHPFFAFEYLLEHFRRKFCREEHAQRDLIECYANEWQETFPTEPIRKALLMTPVLAVFAYAARCAFGPDVETSGNAQLAGYLRGLTRRMSREAGLMQGRPQCCT